MKLDTSVVFLALLIVAVALCTWWQNRVIAKRVALAVEIAADIQYRKLDEIYKLANSRLSDSLQTIEDLKALLLVPRTTAVDELRITQAIAKNS